MTTAFLPVMGTPERSSISTHPCGVHEMGKGILLMFSHGRRPPPWVEVVETAARFIGCSPSTSFSGAIALIYCDRHRLPKDVEEKWNLKHWDNWKDMVQHMDVVTLNCPLHPETEHMVNADTIKLFKRGAYIVNTARGKLCDKDVIAGALRDGQLAGYAGDV